MQPSMDACAWIHQAQDRSWRPYVLYSLCVHAYLTVACVLPLASFPEMATSIAGWASTSRKCNPKMPGASSFSKTGSYRVPSTLTRRQQFFVLAQQTGTS